MFDITNIFLLITQIKIQAKPVSYNINLLSIYFKREALNTYIFDFSI